MSSASAFVPDRAVILTPIAPVRRDVTTILQDQRIDVVQAEGPEHLLSIANKTKLDFAVIGSEVVESHARFLTDIRSMDPFLPVILLSSGRISPQTWQEVLKVGLVGYLPINELSAHELVASVRSLMEYRLEKQSVVCRVDDPSDRISRIMRVLEEVFGSREDALRWLRSPHPDLGGRRPLAYVMRGDDDVVADLIEGALAGTFS